MEVTVTGVWPAGRVADRLDAIVSALAPLGGSVVVGPEFAEVTVSMTSGKHGVREAGWITGVALRDAVRSEPLRLIVSNDAAGLAPIPLAS
jgi:hypothetical protein